MDAIERILELVKVKAKSKRAFAMMIQMEQVTFNNYMIGKRSLGYECIDAILKTFPDISAEWLLRGEGEMLKEVEAKSDDALVRGLLDAIQEQQKKIDRLLASYQEMEERANKAEELVKKLKSA